MNKFLCLIAVLFILIGVGACTPGPIKVETPKVTTIEVTKTITFTQEGEYLRFRYTRLEPGMVFIVAYDSKLYQLDRDSVYLEAKGGKIYGQVNVPMRDWKVAAVTLSYRGVFCSQTFVTGVESGEEIEFQCTFPAPNSDAK